MGRGIVETGLGRTERLALQVRTTDPGTTREGEAWIRSDVQPKTDQIATLRVDNGSGTWDVPIFDSAASAGSNVTPALRVRVGGVTGFVPATDGAAAFPALRAQHNGATFKFHDALTVSAIPDSGNLHAQYATRLLDGYSGGDTVDPFTDDAGTNDAPATGAPIYRENEQNSQPAVNYDGVDDYHDTGYSVDTNNPRSIYAVWNPTASKISALGAVNTTGDSTRCYMGVSNDGELIGGYGSTNNIFGPTTADGSYWILSFVADSGGTLAAYNNGSQVGSVSYSTNGDVGLNQYLGARNLDGSAATYWPNHIAEVLDYQAGHDDTTRNEVESYLNNKYAVF